MQNIADRNKLIIDHQYLADFIAKKKKRNCIPSIQLSELKSAAYMGLLDAATKFDENKGKFKVYARYRIYGAINDYLRKYYGFRRKKIVKVWSLDVPIYINNCMKTSPLEDMIAYEDEVSVKLSNEDSFRKICECLNNLEKNIFNLYYLSGLTMKTIAYKLNYTESRICQIISGCIQRIRDNFSEDESGLFEFKKCKSINFRSDYA